MNETLMIKLAAASLCITNEKEQYDQWYKFYNNAIKPEHPGVEFEDFMAKTIVTAVSYNNSEKN